MVEIPNSKDSVSYTEVKESFFGSFSENWS